MTFYGSITKRSMGLNVIVMKFTNHVIVRYVLVFAQERPLGSIHVQLLNTTILQIQRFTGIILLPFKCIFLYY